MMSQAFSLQTVSRPRYPGRVPWAGINDAVGVEGNYIRRAVGGEETTTTATVNPVAPI